MTKSEHLLTILSEEAGEIVQDVSKILRFGKDNYNPSTGIINEDALLTEFYQLEAMMDLLQREHIIKKLPPNTIAQIKQDKINKTMYYMHLREEDGLTQIKYVLYIRNYGGFYIDAENTSNDFETTRKKNNAKLFTQEEANQKMQELKNAGYDVRIDYIYQSK